MAEEAGNRNKNKGATNSSKNNRFNSKNITCALKKVVAEEAGDRTCNKHATTSSEKFKFDEKPPYARSKRWWRRRLVTGNETTINKLIEKVTNFLQNRHTRDQDGGVGGGR